MSQTKTAKQKPLTNIRVGNVQAAIWQRNTGKGIFFDVSFQRSYKTTEGWGQSGSYDLGSLMALGVAVRKAIDKILELNNHVVLEIDNHLQEPGKTEDVDGK